MANDTNSSTLRLTLADCTATASLISERTIAISSMPCRSVSGCSFSPSGDALPSKAFSSAKDRISSEASRISSPLPSAASSSGSSPMISRNAERRFCRTLPTFAFELPDESSAMRDNGIADDPLIASLISLTSMRQRFFSILGMRSAVLWSRRRRHWFISSWNLSNGRSLASSPKGSSSSAQMKFMQHMPKMGRNVKSAASHAFVKRLETRIGVKIRFRNMKKLMSCAKGNGNLVSAIFFAFRRFTKPRESVW
mmetsp:Transcript_75840/g.133963  ORF Transcript_75840/g.133963 Transcript_75840/m.133963 type:complete len:253 (-) Transcript_75840:103-861(-)